MKVFLFTTVYILSHLLRILLCKFNPVFLFLLQLASALSKYMQTLIHSHLIRATGNILNCRNVQNIYLSIKEDCVPPEDFLLKKVNHCLLSFMYIYWNNILSKIK